MELVSRPSLSRLPSEAKNGTAVSIKKQTVMSTVKKG